MCHVSHVRCHMSCVTCHVSHVTCQYAIKVCLQRWGWPCWFPGLDRVNLVDKRQPTSARDPWRIEAFSRTLQWTRRGCVPSGGHSVLCWTDLWTPPLTFLSGEKVFGLVIQGDWSGFLLLVSVQWFYVLRYFAICHISWVLCTIVPCDTKL